MKYLILILALTLSSCSLLEQKTAESFQTHSCVHVEKDLYECKEISK